jgi:glutathione S-transferase
LIGNVIAPFEEGTKVTHQEAITLQGIHGSPYTRKMLAVLRFRRMPYRFIVNWPQNPDAPGNGENRRHLPKPKVPLLPTVYLPDENGKLEAVTDTTPIIRRLESHLSTRSVLPSSPVLAFLNYVLEDYADEWLTRCMFHYRWHFEADIKKAGRILPLYVRVDQSPDMLDAQTEEFTRRQVDRLHVVGSNQTTASTIEASYERYLRLLESHLQDFPFLFGNRPASADFAMMGQLTCLTHFDPTPMRLCEGIAPRVYAWVERLEDLSGYEVTEQDWLTGPDRLPDTVIALLAEVARTHMPQLLANAQALIEKRATFTTEIDGRDWTQPSFPYQLKCLRWTRDEFRSLSSANQASARTILEAAGLSPLIDAEIGEE